MIALLDRDDRDHRKCIAAAKTIREPLASVLPAVTEAMHLLRSVTGAQALLCDMLSDGGVQLLHVDAADLPRIKQLMQKYRDRPMDFADAALVRVAEREGLSRILTFDADFAIYRLPRRAGFTIVS